MKKSSLGRVLNYYDCGSMSCNYKKLRDAIEVVIVCVPWHSTARHACETFPITSTHDVEGFRLGMPASRIFRDGLRVENGEIFSITNRQSRSFPSTEGQHVRF